jgi:hypothetical protein
MSARIAVIKLCAYCRYGLPERNFGYCNHPRLSSARAKTVDLDAPPPDWCPLTPAADVARVKPLEWADVSDEQHLSRKHFTACERRYEVKQYPWGEFSYFDQDDSCWREAETLDAAKAACEAHYRAALFGPDGPLVQIEVPNA